jgi:hypothetical protein
MAPEVVGEHEGVVQNGEKEIAGFSEKYNPTTRLHGVKTQKRTN